MKLGHEGAIGAPCSAEGLCLLYFARRIAEGSSQQRIRGCSGPFMKNAASHKRRGTDRSRLHEIRTTSIVAYMAGNRLDFSRERNQLHKDIQRIRLEEHEAGVGDGGIVLIGDTPIVAKDLAFFCLDQSQQTVDG